MGTGKTESKVNVERIAPFLSFSMEINKSESNDRQFAPMEVWWRESWKIWDSGVPKKIEPLLMIQKVFLVIAHQGAILV